MKASESREQRRFQHCVSRCSGRGHKIPTPRQQGKKSVPPKPAKNSKLLSASHQLYAPFSPTPFKLPPVAAAQQTLKPPETKASSPAPGQRGTITSPLNTTSLLLCVHHSLWGHSSAGGLFWGSSSGKAAWALAPSSPLPSLIPSCPFPSRPVPPCRASTVPTASCPALPVSSGLQLTCTHTHQ